MTDLGKMIEQAQNNTAQITRTIEQLTIFRDQSVAEIAKYLRVGSPDFLDVDAIKATLTRPYTIIPINENEATLIHWRGVRMPIFGWVVKQEPAFTISRVSRGMGLLTKFPTWVTDELGWRAPEHSAIIDSTRTSIHLESGDEASFKKKYGASLGPKQSDGSFKIKGGDAWMKLVASLIKDGILPYTPKPVEKKDWNNKATSKIELKDYQSKFVQEFKDKGAVFFNLPPGAGKTMISLYIMAHLYGKILVLAPTVILCEQWKSRVEEYAPGADVTILTYASGQKALKEKWTMVIFDEVQTLPADTFSKLAFLETKYRAGLSASPWREDGRQYMITALSGFPCSIRWADLIREGVLKRPRVVIATVANETAKTAFTRQLIDKRKSGRALIFCDYLEAGQKLADSLDVPFVSGETSRKLEKVIDSEVCVVSRIADRGLDFKDLTLVVEWAFMGKSREQEAQRLGRLLHSQSKGEHYLLFTPEEAAKFRPRIFGIESELSGEIDLEFITVGKIEEKKRDTTFVARSKPSRPKPKPTGEKKDEDEKKYDEVYMVLKLPSIAVKMAAAEKNVGANTIPYLRRVFRYCFSAPFSPKELCDGLGMTGEWARSKISASCKALNKVGLLIEADGRYQVDDFEVRRAKTLSSAIK